MAAHGASLKGSALALLFAATTVLADPSLNPEKLRGVDWNFDAVLESVSAPRAGALDWNFEAAVSLDVDLGEVTGLDHWYVFVHPTLTWGVEESYGWKLRAYLAWLSWDGSENWNFLAGLYDLGWHFQSLPSASVFTRLPGENTGNFSPGAIGLLDPFPLSSPALRFEVKPGKDWAVQLASLWLEQGHNFGAHQLARGSERWLVIAEANWSREGTKEYGYGHRYAGIGTWVLPGAQLDDSRRTPLGVYAFGDARLWNEALDPEQGISAFASVSAAAHRAGPWERRVAAGVEWTGLIPRRNRDRTALALIAEETAATSAASGQRRWGAAAELLHRLPLGDHAYLQGSAQWRSRLSGDDPTGHWKLGVSIGISL